MTNQEMRQIKEQLGIIDFKITYKTGVHYGIIEDFFKGKTEDLEPRDRERIEAMLKAELKKAKK